MADRSAIEWTEATWNPTTGCTKVSPGCAHCYIDRTPPFRIAGNRFVDGKTDITIFHDRLEQPLHWRKPRRIFVNSLSDLFHDGISDAFIDRVFAVMALSPQHTFQVLTKRAERMRAYLTDPDRRACIAEQWWELLPGPEPKRVNFSLHPMDTWPLPNVWLGVSVENQHFADERIPLLLQTPAAVRFVSYEPALEYVNFRQWVGALDWIIFGLESGAGARSGDADWGRDLITACVGAKARPFIKQLGANGFDSARTASGRSEVLNLRSRKGGDPDEWPEDLRVREFPEART